MEVLKKTLYVLLGIIAIMLVVALFLPKERKMHGSIVINAPDYIVFEQVNNLQKWLGWMPFTDDSSMHTTFEGPPSGVGAKMVWDGKKTGKGTLTIKESVPYFKIVSDLDFMEQGKALDSWVLSPTEGGIQVDWTTQITSLSYPVERIMGMFMNSMMKPYFERGLNSLKAVSESLPVTFSCSQVCEKTSDEILAIVIKDSVTEETIGQSMGINYGILMQFATRNKLEIAGLPFAEYPQWIVGQKNLVIIGIPVSKKIKTMLPVEMYKIAASNNVMVSYFGPYEKSAYGHEKINQYIIANKKEINGFSREVYISDPQLEPDPTKWETQIFYPIK